MKEISLRITLVRNNAITIATSALLAGQRLNQ